jgi:hypothetical protein
MSYSYPKYFILLIFCLASLLLSSAVLAVEIKLAWDPPTTNGDGTPLTDLAGYKVYYGTTSGTYGSPINVGNVTTYTLAGLTPGQSYFIVVTAYDSSDNESGYSNEVSGVATEPMLISLKTGWNLISISTLSGNTLITEILSGISGKYDRVEIYKGCDTADPWKIYDPVLPLYANDLQYVNATVGIWIEMKQDVDFSVSGLFPLMVSTPLCPGWNLISYAGKQAKPVAEALSSISGKYERVYSYRADDTTDPWKIYDVSVPSYTNDLVTMEPGLGYWIYIKENCTLTISN